MRVVALLTARNEEAYLERCLTHLHSQGIETCLVDNGSTDRTRAIAEAFRVRGVFRIETLPFSGDFDLSAQLEQQQKLADEIPADWFIHQDADEILEGPPEWPTLSAAIAAVDAQGFDAINFDEFVFSPIAGEDFDGRDYVALIRRYYFFEPRSVRLIRAWKKGAGLNLASSGGHRAIADRTRPFPRNFILRHYVGLSLSHLKAQYLGRVFPADELERGWHRNRVATTLDFVRLPKPDQLIDVDREGWRIDRKHKTHLLFHQPEPYKPPVRIKGDEVRTPIPFVVGIGHESTAMLCRLLNAHPDLAMASEVNWPSEALDVSRTEDFGERVRAIYRDYAVKAGKARAGDATPDRGSRMVDIAAVLPEARFVHVIRDGRDVGPSLDDRDPESAAAQWIWRVREIRQQGQFVPYYREVRFEDLKADPERILRGLANFIGLPFDSAQLRAAETDVARPAMSPADRARFTKIAGRVLSDLGYPA